MASDSRDEDLLKVGVVTGCVIQKDGKFLLVQEKKPEVYGLWNWPAGKVEKGISLEENAIKEAKEETGFDVELIREVGIFHEKVDGPVKHAYEAKIIGGELSVPEDEILDAGWFSIEEIKKLEQENKLRAKSFIIGTIDLL